MSTLFTFVKRYQNALLFVTGFLFDTVTIRRVDSQLDLAFQLFYLATVTALLLLQYREHHRVWAPGPRVGRVWPYNVEALHFIYGGLLSNYVVIYFKSASGSRPVVFFLFLVVLLFINELPQIRRYGYRLRLGLYAFCVSSFLI